MKKLLFFLPILFVSLGYSQTKTEIFKKQEININTLLKGSLYTPLKNSKKETLVILIAGSGPTDRNGNQKNVVNNSLKYLCEGLAQNDIALDYIVPDQVHVLARGQIVKSGTRELALELEARGYDWLSEDAA